MTPEEIRNTPCPYPAGTYFNTAATVWQVACASIADRMEREGAEQAEALHENYLRHLGAKWNPDDECWCIGGLRIAQWCHEWRIGFGGRDVDSWMAHPTRADVLHLLSALGINITQEEKQ
jgi:hypothetical protein